MGDSIDNVPGVPGIGEKTAIALIQEYGSLDNLYQNLDAIQQKKRRDNLRNGKESAYLSQELVTIKTDVPLELREDDFHRKPVARELLLSLYRELEFRSFAAELEEKTPTSPADRKYETVDSLEALREVLRRIQEQKSCAVDTETTSLNALSARLVGLSLSVEEKQGWYVPVGHTQGRNIPWEEAQPLLREILESESIAKVGHNLKYDLQVLRNEGIRLQGIADDTLMASYLVQPEQSSHKLDDLVGQNFGMKMTPITDLIGKGKNQISMAEVEIERVSDYACEDSDATWRLRTFYAPKIDELGLRPLYQEVEIPLLTTLAEMERRGVHVNPVILEEQSREVGIELNALEQEIFHSVGKEFNLNSPMQLAQILYDDLKLLSGRSRSTRADLLEKLAADGVPIAQQILEYRRRQKIKSTYLDALRKLIRPDTGRVHTTYNQAGAGTGRISSSDPNLQNIPIRTELGHRVRRAFIAAEGCLLVSLDYSQIELRILAHISQDSGLLAAFAAGDDIHRRTASEIFGVPIEAVTPDMRRKAKEINFGLNYGMSSYGLARRLGIEEKEASSYIETYFTRYPQVQRYMDETVVSAQDRLYVTTVLGRRIPTPGIRDSNKNNQENAKRAAINAPIQGAAADLLKTAMVQVDRALSTHADTAAILLTVHDELILEVREDRAEETVRICRERMEQAMKFSVPTPVEWSIGRSWADLK